MWNTSSQTNRLKEGIVGKNRYTETEKSYCRDMKENREEIAKRRNTSREREDCGQKQINGDGEV